MVKKVVILASVVMLAGCSFYDVKERLNNGWKIVTNPNTYSYEIHEDGSVTTYIKLTGDK